MNKKFISGNKRYDLEWMADRRHIASQDQTGCTIATGSIPSALKLVLTPVNIRLLIMRLNKLYQALPGDHVLHLVKEPLITPALALEVCREDCRFLLLNLTLLYISFTIFKVVS